jgi:hypothetical protein
MSILHKNHLSKHISNLPPQIELMKRKGDLRGLSDALMGQDLKLKLPAAMALGELGNVLALTEALKHRDLLTRMAAADGLTSGLPYADNVQNIEALVRLLEDKAVSQVAAAALKGLRWVPKTNRQRTLLEDAEQQGKQHEKRDSLWVRLFAPFVLTVAVIIALVHGYVSPTTQLGEGLVLLPLSFVLVHFLYGIGAARLRGMEHDVEQMLVETMPIIQQATLDTARIAVDAQLWDEALAVLDSYVRSCASDGPETAQAYFLRARSKYELAKIGGSIPMAIYSGILYDLQKAQIYDTGTYHPLTENIDILRWAVERDLLAQES